MLFEMTLPHAKHHDEIRDLLFVRLQIPPCNLLIHSCIKLDISFIFMPSDFWLYDIKGWFEVSFHLSDQSFDNVCICFRLRCFFCSNKGKFSVKRYGKLWSRRFKRRKMIHLGRINFQIIRELEVRARVDVKCWLLRKIYYKFYLLVDLKYF